MFTLKVIKNENNEWVSYSKHYHGGIDTKQEQAFLHLVPRGFIEDVWAEILFDLAEIHGWKVEIIK